MGQLEVGGESTPYWRVGLDGELPDGRYLDGVGRNEELREEHGVACFEALLSALCIFWGHVQPQQVEPSPDVERTLPVDLELDDGGDVGWLRCSRMEEVNRPSSDGLVRLGEASPGHRSKAMRLLCILQLGKGDGPRRA